MFQKNAWTAPAIPSLWLWINLPPKKHVQIIINIHTYIISYLITVLINLDIDLKSQSRYNKFISGYSVNWIILLVFEMRLSLKMAGGRVAFRVLGRAHVTKWCGLKRVGNKPGPRAIMSGRAVSPKPDFTKLSVPCRDSCRVETRRDSYRVETRRDSCRVETRRALSSFFHKNAAHGPRLRAHAVMQGRSFFMPVLGRAFSVPGPTPPTAIFSYHD